MRRRTTILYSSAVVMAVGGSLRSLAAAPAFFPLGGLDAGESSSSASAMSSNGGFVAGTSSLSRAPARVATRWDLATGSVTPLLGTPADDGFNRTPVALSDDGMTVAGTARTPGVPEDSEAFRWTTAAGFETLAALSSDLTTSANDASSDGAIVVGSSRGSILSTAVRWDAQGDVTALGTLPTSTGFPSSDAAGVSADGQVIAGTSTSGIGQEAFVWTAADGMVGLGTLPGGAALASQARDISADGTTVVGSSFSADFPTSGEAMIWTTSEGMQGLGVLRESDSSSSAQLVSSDGSLVFGSSRQFDDQGEVDQLAFVWGVSFGMRDFTDVLITDYGLGSALDGWTDIWPNDIADDSLVIVGTGINPDGDFEAWAVTLDRPIGVPEPSGVASVVIATLIAAGCSIQLSKRRKHAM